MISPSPKRVLCAERSSDIGHMLTAFLVLKGYEVRSAGSIAECLELARSEHFDLYLLDSGYPDGSSLELCQKLRELHPDTPIMFFSCAGYERDRRAAFACGAQAYMVRPGDIEELVLTIGQLSSGNSFQPTV